MPWPCTHTRVHEILSLKVIGLEGNGGEFLFCFVSIFFGEEKKEERKKAEKCKGMIVVCAKLHELLRQAEGLTQTDREREKKEKRKRNIQQRAAQRRKNETKMNVNARKLENKTTEKEEHNRTEWKIS